MPCLKIVRFFIKLFGFIGFIMIIGAVGESDYQETMGNCYPLVNTVKALITGALMMVPSITLILKER